jgi:hypothetical protein
MAIKRPAIYEHNNPNLPIVDSDFVKGGSRTSVPNLTELYNLANKTSQLKEYSTRVYVTGENKFYFLKDVSNVGNSNGWQDETTQSDLSLTVRTTGNQNISGIKSFQRELAGSRDYFFDTLKLPGFSFSGGNGLKLVGDNFTGSKAIGSHIYLSGGNASLIGGSILLEAGQGVVEDGIIAAWGDRFSFNDNAFTINNVGTISARSASFLFRPTVNGSGFLLSGEGITVSNLVQTGLRLDTKINNLSGYSDNRFATISSLNSVNQNLTSQIGTLGNSLVSTGASIISLSGTLTGNYATVTRVNNLSGYINSPNSNIVFTTGNQIISGVKTFSTGINFNSGESVIENIDNKGLKLIGYKFKQDPGVVSESSLNLTKDGDIIITAAADANVLDRSINIQGGYTTINGYVSLGLSTENSTFINLKYDEGIQIKSLTGTQIYGYYPDPNNAVDNYAGILLNADGSVVIKSANDTNVGEQLISFTTRNQKVADLRRSSTTWYSPFNFIGNRPTVNNTGVLLSGEAALASNLFATGANLQNQIDNLDVINASQLPNTVVYTTGNQTISGVKSFKETSNFSSLSTNGITVGSQIDQAISISNESEGDMVFAVSSQGQEKYRIVYNTGNINFNSTPVSFNGPATFGTRPTVNDSGVLLSGEIPALPNTIVYTTGNQTISGNKTFSASRYVFSGANVVFVNNTGIVSGQWQFSNRPTVNGTGVLLSGESVSPLVDINNITANFNFISGYNSKLLAVNSTQPITGTVQLNLPTGYNVSFTQIGVGQLRITGQNGVTIRQRSNLYYTAGRYAMASLVHHSGNQYILYGDLG